MFRGQIPKNGQSLGYAVSDPAVRVISAVLSQEQTTPHKKQQRLVLMFVCGQARGKPVQAAIGLGQIPGLVQPIQVVRLTGQALVNALRQGIGFTLPGQDFQPGAFHRGLPVAGRKSQHAPAPRRQLIQPPLQAQRLHRGRAAQRIGLPSRKQQLAGQAQLKGMLLRRTHSRQQQRGQLQ